MKMAVDSSDSIMQDTTMFTGIFTGMEHVTPALGHLRWHKKFTSFLEETKKRRNCWLGDATTENIPIFLARYLLGLCFLCFLCISP
jgi:hypothetical protein